MAAAQRRTTRTTPPRLRPVSALIALAALATVVVGALNMRVGPAWPYRLLPLVPRGIVVHHSATPTYVQGRQVDAAFLDEVHATQGWGMRYGERVYHIGYHYVILPDGSVEPGRPEWMPGAHTVGYNNYLGICLVGDFSRPAGHPPQPTRAQVDALVKLIRQQIKKHRLSPQRLYRHRDLDATECPGIGVPWEEIVARVNAGN